MCKQFNLGHYKLRVGYVSYVIIRLHYTRKTWKPLYTTIFDIMPIAVKKNENDIFIFF